MIVGIILIIIVKQVTDETRKHCTQIDFVSYTPTPQIYGVNKNGGRILEWK